MPQARNRFAVRRAAVLRAPANPDVVRWDVAVAQFLAECKRRGHTPATLSVYRSALLGPRTEEFRRDQKIEMVRDFTAAHLRAYEMELQAAELSPATVHQYHRTLKTFLGFCAREGMLVDERVHDVMAPRVPQTEPDAYTLDEEKRLLAAARHPRDRLILAFLLATGLRLSELIHLEVEDVVDLGRQGAYLRVRQGKGRKDRHVPLDDDIYRELQTYLRRVRPSGPGAVFIARRMKDEIRPMTGESLKTVLRRIGEDAGVHCHAHKFRHTFASRAITNGVDPITLQRVLGHTTLQMVSRYVHYSATDLVRAWRNAGTRSQAVSAR